MGIFALCDITEDAIVLDVGGTTTDIGVFAAGDPLIEPENVRLKGRPTLVRAMKVKSIGLGGDSAVTTQGDRLLVGPKRLGPCMAKGGDVPAFLDALNCICEEAYGDKDASFKGMQQIKENLNCSLSDAPIKVVEEGCKILKKKRYLVFWMK